MAMSEEAQKATLNDIYSRSLHQPRGQAARRQALIKIIQLTRSPFPSVKKESSQVLGTFFEEFPDIQDQVVDAVYDLCEDSNPEVRLDGYKVIVELSKRVKTWTRRNTDVLIQLLQSEDIVELGVVKRSLLEHIKNDPEGALGVMCDYCIGSSDAPDTALKGLVINFLLYDAKSEREKILSSVPEPEAAKTLRAGLVQSIPRADIVQLPIILNDLLFPPPARSPAGLLPAALEALMAQSGLVLDQELPTSPTLPDTMLHLSLASGLLRQPGDPTHLLRFLTGRIVPLSMDLTVLAKLEPDTRFMLVSHTTEVFKTCRSKANSATAWPELLALRNKMTDVGNVWPDIILQNARARPSDDRIWVSAATLLSAMISRRKDDPAWKGVPILKIRDLQNLAEVSANQHGSASAKETIGLAKALLSPKPTPATTTPAFPPAKGPATKPEPISTHKRKLGNDHERRQSPSVPLVAPTPSPRLVSFPATNTASSASASTANEVRVPAPKRLKQEKDDVTIGAPSLLQRLGSVAQGGPDRRATALPRSNSASTISGPSPAQQPPVASRIPPPNSKPEQSRPPDPPNPRRSISIRGAARTLKELGMLKDDPPPSTTPQQPAPPLPRKHSLLDRIGGSAQSSLIRFADKRR